MDAKEQIIFNLKREIQLLQLENEWLKSEVMKLNGGKPIVMPMLENPRQPSQQSSKLPPLNSKKTSISQNSMVGTHYS